MSLDSSRRDYKVQLSYCIDVGVGFESFLSKSTTTMTHGDEEANSRVILDICYSFFLS